MWASSVSEAPKSAAFASFGNLRGYRDFLKLEAQRPTPKSACGRKRTSTAEYEYIGTLISRESFDTVTKECPIPPLQARDVSAQKKTREAETLAGLQKAAKGKYKEQFSFARLSDAIASSERKWSHFQDMPSALPPQALRLPSELAAEMRSRGLRGPHGQRLLSPESAESRRVEAAVAKEFADVTEGPPPRLKRRFFANAEDFGFKTGKEVGQMPAEARVLTDSEFQKQPVYPGCFVITRAALKSHWSKSSSTLHNVDFWLWRVSKVHAPGTKLSKHSMPCAQYTYEAHLYRPRKTQVAHGRQSLISPAHSSCELMERKPNTNGHNSNV